jgi:hypothetical protein
VQSPKFKFIRSDLDNVFNKSSLRTEWKKRVKYQIRKQLIFDPIEYRDFSDDLENLIESIRSEIMSGSYQVSPAKRYLSEKSRGLCRQMTLIHPKDLFVLERLSRSFYFELKDKCPSKSAFFEPDDGSFVKGLQPSDFQYGSFASWKRFQKAVFGFASENNFIVVTDVANFYDFINFQHLRNIISSLADVRESILDLLIYILNRLTWTPDFMPISQVGMPQIETTATRVLANALLYEVDKICESSATQNYARFMDDIDFGVDSIPTAKRMIRDIDLTLQSRQLRLNSSKTKILSKKEAYTHFCISENTQISRLEQAMQRNSRGLQMSRVLLNKYEKWLVREIGGAPGKSSPYTKGNGSKIHKRLISLIYESGGCIPDKDLLWLTRHEPGMRSIALRYAARSPNCNKIFNQIISDMRSEVFVDDASIVEISSFLIHAKFIKSRLLEQDISDFIEISQQGSDVRLHCAIFVSSKFKDLESNLRLLNNNKTRIRSDFWLTRAAAGLAPKFFESGANLLLFRDLICGLHSDTAESVYNYFFHMTNISQLSNSLKSYLNATNSSFPQNIYYPKVLHLLAISKNRKVKSLLPKMHMIHPCLKSDPYFRALGF